MNDHHLDPPDYPEPPEWYCLIEQILDEHAIPTCASVAVRKALEEWAESHNQEQDQPEPNYSEPDWDNHYAIAPKSCPHGRPPHDCDACDHLGDLAYDAARESRR